MLFKALTVSQYCDKVAIRAPHFCQVILCFPTRNIPPLIHLRRPSVLDAHFHNYTRAPPRSVRNANVLVGVSSPQTRPPFPVLTDAKQA